MSPNEALSAALVTLLRPLVRILLRYGVPHGAFAELARWVYVDVATKEFGLPGRKQTNSRVSVLTGLSRKEVLRLRKLSQPQDEEASERFNRAARVISAWVRESRFHDEQGEPKALAFDGEGTTFSDLVRLYSGDVPPRALFDELARVGAVQRTKEGHVRLLTRAYVPVTESAEVDKLAILGTDVAALVSTIGHNLRAEGPDALFQRKVSYVGVPASAVPTIRNLAARRSQAVLEELDRALSTSGRNIDLSSGDTPSRKRVLLGIYYFEEDLEEESEEQP